MNTPPPPDDPNSPPPDDGDDDLTTIRVDQFFPHPPAKVWRALTDPELLAQWQMPGSEYFRLEVGHRYRMTSVPRPNSRFSGVVEVEVLAYDTPRTLSLRWADADPANPADWTITWTLEQEGRGTRLFLVHEGFDPDDPAQLMARRIMGGGWRTHVMRSLGQTLERFR
ncbi:MULTISPECIES: SRPBCC family protein [Streptomyces]|uniref:ATPase n=2 Tax=Streptomyces TaxID=1883 RepID=A0A2U9P647_STRAS|nr:SRPBCC domain-containing protein [Streptomyces actuosus]AWT44641.1 ATPase [Streptomyces actuosus]MBM4820150.1 SRPBCC domain-containing protein [Streptomyces actuosus]